jgi:hypothetical protein
MTFQDLLNQYACQSFEKQLHLQEQVRLDGPWTYSVDETRLTLSDRPVTATVLGSEAPGPGTWLWSWANTQSDFPAHATRHALKLREYGERHRVPQLSSPETPLDAWSSLQLAVVAVGILDTSGYYLADAGHATVVLVIDDASLQRPSAPFLPTLVTVINGTISAVPVNHRAAIEHYLRARGFTLTAAHRRLTAHHAEAGEIVVTFDSRDRLKQLESRNAPKAP